MEPQTGDTCSGFKVSGWNGNFPQCFAFVSLFMTTPGGFWKHSHIQRNFDFLFLKFSYNRPGNCTKAPYQPAWWDL